MMVCFDIDYDLLIYESEILWFDFFVLVFEKFKESGVVKFELLGKNEGCWVMLFFESEEFQGFEDFDKVIVCLDGIVIYVGKDIVYQFWKFGLFGQDFEYVEKFSYWQMVVNEQSVLLIQFGVVYCVVNVIDVCQSYLQKIVWVGFEVFGYIDEVECSIYFVYEMVFLLKNMVVQFGYVDDDGEGKLVEMLGCKGVGVKVDDMFD